MIRRLIPLAPLLVILGALVLIVASGAEIASGVRGWLGGMPWPPGMLLDALVAGSATVLAAAVLISRRSTMRTAKAEQALRESEERLRLVANNVPALIAYLDREAHFRFSNRTYDDWFGIPQERMLGRHVAEVFGEQSHARMQPHFERVLAGQEVEFELDLPSEGAEVRMDPIQMEQALIEIVSNALDRLVAQFPEAVASFFVRPDPEISEEKLALLQEAIERRREAGG